MFENKDYNQFLKWVSFEKNGKTIEYAKLSNGKKLTSFSKLAKPIYDAIYGEQKNTNFINIGKGVMESFEIYHSTGELPDDETKEYVKSLNKITKQLEIEIIEVEKVIVDVKARTYGKIDALIKHKGEWKILEIKISNINQEHNIDALTLLQARHYNKILGIPSLILKLDRDSKNQYQLIEAQFTKEQDSILNMLKKLNKVVETIKKKKE